MKMEIECTTCFARQAQKAAELSTEDFDIRLKAVKKAADEISRLDPEDTPPETATKVFKVIIAETGNVDAYKELKQKSNELVCELIPFAEKLINNSRDHFLTAVNISMTGNIIDYGILEDFNVAELLEREALLEDKKKAVDIFREKLLRSKKLLFIADNAGEIGFDSLMLDQVKKINPDIAITVFLKSLALINDATLEDAEYFNMEKRFNLVEYPDTVGFKYKDMPAHISRIIEESDCIISKGQANYEILSSSDIKGIVYLLRAKCGVVARHIGVPEGCPVILV